MLAKQQLCTLHFVTVVAQLLHLRVYALLVFLQGTFAHLLTNGDLLLNPLTRIFIFFVKRSLLKSIGAIKIFDDDDDDYY